MSYTNRTITISPEEMELWRLKHPGESFSAWVRQQVEDDVNPILTKEVEIDQEQVFEDPTPAKCPQGKYQGMIVSAVECSYCNLSCSQRKTD